HNGIGRDFGSVGQRYAVRTLAGDHNAEHTLVFADGGPCPLGGRAQGRYEFTVVDLMVLRAVDRASEGRSQMRLPPPPLGPADPLQWEVKAALELEMMMQSR